MSGRTYVLLVILCAAWLGIRAFTQPSGFAFDEPAHMGTLVQVREFGGLAPAHLFPEIIVNPRTVEPRFHMFPPLPYLVMAGATVLVEPDATAVAAVRMASIQGMFPLEAVAVDPVAAKVLLVGRTFSALLALIAVVAAGLAVRNLQPRGATWSVPAAVTAGMALMPYVHGLGASVTASTWALAAVGAICAATTWAVRRRWSVGATAVVAGVAALAVAFRASAYPALVLIPLAMLAARVAPTAAVRRLAAIAAAVIAVNVWWYVRNLLVTGDPLGTNVYLSTVADVGACDGIAPESHLWCSAATGPWPAWTLLTSTDIFWVYLSRMLLGRTWIDTLTIALWVAMVVIPALALLVYRIRNRKTTPPPVFPLLMAASGFGAAFLAFALAITLSGDIGWYVYARDTLIASVLLVVALAALADLRHDRLRTAFFGSTLAFAATANAGFILAVLPNL